MERVGGEEVGEEVVSNCGGLNENDSHRLKYLNTWSPVYKTLWEGVRSLAFLK